MQVTPSGRAGAPEQILPQRVLGLPVFRKNEQISAPRPGWGFWLRFSPLQSHQSSLREQRKYLSNLRRRFLEGGEIQTNLLPGSPLCHATVCKRQWSHAHPRITSRAPGESRVGDAGAAPYLGGVQEGGDAWPPESRALPGAGGGGGVLNRSPPASGQ